MPKRKNKKFELYVGVDIGARNLGVAILTAEALRKIKHPQARYNPGIVYAASCLTVSHKKYPDTLQAASVLCAKLDSWVRKHQNAACLRAYATSNVRRILAIEFPVARLGDSVGFVSTSGGDTIALGYAAGLYQGFSADLFDDVLLVTPQQWKGQLSKRITEQRMRRVIDPIDAQNKQIKSHAWDAVGLALFAAGISINDPSMAL